MIVTISKLSPICGLIIYISFVVAWSFIFSFLRIYLKNLGYEKYAGLFEEAKIGKLYKHLLYISNILIIKILRDNEWVDR